MKGNALKQESSSDVGAVQARDTERAVKKEDSKTSVWEQFVSGPSNPCMPFKSAGFYFLVIHSPQNSHKSSMSKLLSSKYTISSESPAPTTSAKADIASEFPSISTYWIKEKETATSATQDASDPLTYYQQQSNYLEGGVTITGKAPSKTERKSHRKELAKERKNLMKEVKVDSVESSSSSKSKTEEEKPEEPASGRKKKNKEENTEAASSTQKISRLQNALKKIASSRKGKKAQEENEKSPSSRVAKRAQRTDAAKNGPEGKKRRQKEAIRYRWSWDVHLQKFFSQARLLQESDLEFLVRSFQVTYGKPLESGASLMDIQQSCLATCVFCFILNDSTNTFQQPQTVHTDIVNHNYPIAFYFTLYLPDGESSFVLPLTGDVDTGVTEGTITPVVDFFKTFFSLPRLLKITFGFQRFLRLLDFYVQRHGGKCLLNADFCSRSCMDVLLLAWILDSDYQGILEDRSHPDAASRDTPEMDSSKLQAPYRTFESVWNACEKESLDPNAIWNQDSPESYLQSLERGVKKMHVRLEKLFYGWKSWSN